MRIRKTHLLSGLLSACLLVSATPLISAAETYPKSIGDVNKDGSVTVSDAVAILQYVGNSDKFALDGEALSRADVYMRGDGVTARDALSVMMYDAGLLASLPESWMEEPPTEAATEELTEPTTEPPAELEEVETYIRLKGTSIDVDGKYAQANGSAVTISHSGSYYIEGSLSDGQIRVEVPDENADAGTVKLVFKGVDISGKSAPAIFVKNANKTSITVEDGTENSISDGETAYSGDYLDNALIEAKDDLTIKGGGMGMWGFNMWGGQGGLYSYGGDKVSIVDFMIKRNEYIHKKLGY